MLIIEFEFYIMAVKVMQLKFCGHPENDHHHVREIYIAAPIFPVPLNARLLNYDLQPLPNTHLHSRSSLQLSATTWQAGGGW